MFVERHRDAVGEAHRDIGRDNVRARENGSLHGLCIEGPYRRTYRPGKFGDTIATQCRCARHGNGRYGVCRVVPQRIDIREHPKEQEDAERSPSAHICQRPDTHPWTHTFGAACTRGRSICPWPLTTHLYSFGACPSFACKRHEAIKHFGVRHATGVPHFGIHAKRRKSRHGIDF